MNPSELLRLVDSLHREKDIDSESVFKGIEAALLSAARKHLGASENLVVTIDRQTGQITAHDGEREIDPSELGRIAAQTAKQVMIQKIREAERDSISHDFTERVHSVVTGTVQRFEGPNIVVNLAAHGGIPSALRADLQRNLPRRRARCARWCSKCAPSERACASSSAAATRSSSGGSSSWKCRRSAKDSSRSRPSRARPATGRRSPSTRMDPRVDCVGACVGVQGSRIKSIVDELNGEKIDIVRWSDQMDALIANTLEAGGDRVRFTLTPEKRHALVIVPDDQLSLAIGKRGQNVRLAAKLTGWDIDIKPEVPPWSRSRSAGSAAADEPRAEGGNVRGGAAETNPRAGGGSPRRRRCRRRRSPRRRSRADPIQNSSTVRAPVPASGAGGDGAAGR